MGNKKHEQLVGQEFWVDYSSQSRPNTITQVKILDVLGDTCMVEVLKNKRHKLFKISDLQSKDYFMNTESFLVTLTDVSFYNESDDYETQMDTPLFVGIFNVPETEIEKIIEPEINLIKTQDNIASCKICLQKLSFFQKENLNIF